MNNPLLKILKYFTVGSFFIAAFLLVLFCIYQVIIFFINNPTYFYTLAGFWFCILVGYCVLNWDEVCYYLDEMGYALFAEDDD